MHIQAIAMSIVSIFCAVSADAGVSGEPVREYTGREWVNDASGHLLGSSAITMERVRDVRHGRLVVRITRDSPDQHGLLPRESVESLMVVSSSMHPFSLEAKEQIASGHKALHQYKESLLGDVLVVNETYRDPSGHVVLVRVINATPL